MRLWPSMALGPVASGWLTDFWGVRALLVVKIVQNLWRNSAEVGPVLNQKVRKYHPDPSKGVNLGSVRRVMPDLE